MKLKVLLFCMLLPAVVSAQWVSAYYTGFRVKFCEPSELDYSALTHVMHFSIAPRSNGTLDSYVNGIWGYSKEHDGFTNDLIARTHAAGKKILISIGGWNTESAWVGASSSANRTAFIGNIVAFVQDHGYDGVDVDWEQLTNASAFRAFIPQLYAALKAANPNYLMTVACTGESVVAEMAQYFDQINLMTYDWSGAWPGWVVWHNSALFNGGYTFPSVPSKEVPCIQDAVDELAARGVPRSKIGFGIVFEAFLWNGVSEPRQDAAPASGRVQGNVMYSEMMAQYGSLETKWDAVAHATYKTRVSPPLFISYDSEQAIFDKIQWAKQNAGGVIIWSVDAGYTRGAAVPDPLLQAVKSAVGDVVPPPPPPPPPPADCDSAAIYSYAHAIGFEAGELSGYSRGFADGKLEADTVQVPVVITVHDTVVKTVFDTIFVSVPSPPDTVFIPVPGPRDTVYIPVASPPDTVLVPGLRDTMYIIPKSFEVRVKE